MTQSHPPLTAAREAVEPRLVPARMSRRNEWQAFLSLALLERSHAKEYRNWAAEYAAMGKRDLAMTWMQRAEAEWGKAYWHLGQAKSWRYVPYPLSLES